MKLPKGDVLLHAGDISNRGDKREVQEFLNWFEHLPFEHKIFIAGNHDFYFEKQKPAVIKAIIPSTIHYLLDEAVVIGGIKIWGSPYTPKFFQWAFNIARGDAMVEHWKQMPDDAQIIMTHGPAYGILDMIHTEQHAGDKALLDRLLSVQPKVHVCGHIHESHGSVKRHGINFINACMVNEFYEAVYSPIVFEL